MTPLNFDYGKETRVKIAFAKQAFFKQEYSL